MLRGFRSFHPFILLLYYIVIVAGLMLHQHPVFLSSAFILIIAVNFALDRAVELNKWKGMILFLCLFVFILTPIFNQAGTIELFTILTRPIYLEALIQGFMIALTLAGILALFASFNIVITSDKFLYLFSRAFPRWAMILMLALRFVPLFRKKLTEINQVQAMKGISMKDGKLRQKMQNGMLFIQILLTNSLEEAIQTADSMAARGYGLGKRTSYRKFPWKKRDVWLLLIIVILSGVSFQGWYNDFSVLTLMPLETASLDISGFVYLLVWMILLSVPIGTEGKEVIKWRFYQRKI